MRVDLLVEALPIMGTGYLGIFVVTGVIIGVVTMLKKLTGNGFHSHCFTIIQSVIGKYVMLLLLFLLTMLLPLHAEIGVIHLRRNFYQLSFHFDYVLVLFCHFADLQM